MSFIQQLSLPLDNHLNAWTPTTYLIYLQPFLAERLSSGIIPAGKAIMLPKIKAECDYPVKPNLKTAYKIQPIRPHPFLWIDNIAEAIDFYTSIFKNSRTVNITRYGEAGPGPKGTVMVATFELEGQGFTALNGGPEFSFSPATSFLVNCETQEEVDEYWEKLSEGGEK
jgi:3-demethylubiquinone-9 3-methyltransferase